MILACVRAQSLQLCRTLCDAGTVVCLAPLSMGFLGQEYWSELPCPPPGDIPDPGIEPASPGALALQADSLPAVPPGDHNSSRTGVLIKSGDLDTDLHTVGDTA